ncbi:sugar ABC transporter permease [Microbacterium sp. M28]|uniref:carbohydrate ABC transporter permease n=1 Tax=Microbacterium sp. M28 TaxID=2962064 RepID=UPI0021F48143|nr:sugar ABC transporter permease [Microbacterium sp. M28]UYO96564.1 sugar ABC transporter permease [Microbacterium sp. M28]
MTALLQESAPAGGEATRTVVLPPRRARRPHLQRHTGFAYALMAPALVMFALVFVIPIVYSGWLSVRGRGESSGGAFGPREETFVGLGNYVSVLEDPTFWTSLAHLGIYAAIMVPLLMGTSILLALLLDLPRARAKSFSRTSIFLPYGVPSVIAALMWGFLYVPDISPVYQFASTFGIQLPNLLSGDWIYVGIVNVVLWGGIGFNTVIIYTALQSLDRSQIDAARIDGCGEGRIAWYIKLPHVVPATVVTGLFSVIGALQIYSEPAMLATLTNAIDSTFFPLMRVYRDAFAHDDLNSAAAASILLALGTVLLSLLVLGGRRLATRKADR